jgi:hypothetical protein
MNRGMGTFANDLATLQAQGNYLLSAPGGFWQNISTGTLSPAQLQVIAAQNAANNLQAATDPNTGQVNQALLAQANADAAAGVAPAADVSNLSTGSWLANLSDQLQGTYTGALGLPGFTPALGTPVAPPSGGGTDWGSILGTVALLAALGIGGYLVFKAVS